MAPSEDSLAPIRRGGGIAEWIWKGADSASNIYLETLVEFPNGTQLLRHHIGIYHSDERFQIKDERIENERPSGKHTDVMFYYRYFNGRPMVSMNDPERRTRELSRDTIVPDISILAQRRDPDTYPELSFLAGAYEKMKIYREWSFGRRSSYRQPQAADLRNDHLEGDFSNFGMFLSRLRTHPPTKRALISALQNLYEGITLLILKYLLKVVRYK